MYQADEDLLEALAAPDVGDHTVLTFLQGQYEALPWDPPTHSDPGTQPPPDPEEFFKAGDLDVYRTAKAWWPTDAPVQWACPSVYQLCLNYHEPTMGSTFLDRLRNYADPVSAWLVEQGRDLAAPNETPEQRKARLNAEAQRRHRAKSGTGPEAEHARATAAAYAAYMQVCQERKIAMAGWDQRVAEARKAWMDIKQKPPA